MNTTREWCLRALIKICVEGSYSNLYLQKHLEELDQRQRPLAAAIVYGTLQNSRYLRYQWERYVKHQPKPAVALLLDMSIYQLLFLDSLPDYAVIHEAVALCEKTAPKAKGMVNGVLRRFQREGVRELPNDEWKALAVKSSHPDWLVNMWRAQYGEETCRQLCSTAADSFRQCVRVNVMKTTRESLLETGRYAPAALSEDALYYKEGNVASQKEFQCGEVSVQSEASQMVALWMDAKAGEHILDVCSAPGSKACHMAEHMHDQGKIVCGDIHPHRVELIKKGARRLNLSIIDAKVMDATVLDEVSDESFDGVLCDVPCSGYGVMGRKSDLKFHLDPQAMDTLIPLQYQILCCASAKVKKKGRLIYSTCTLNRKENEKQVQRFLKEHSDFVLKKEQTFFPFEHGTDGFYIALLIRE